MDDGPLTADDRACYVFVPIVRCPFCGSDKHTTQRTEHHEGVKTQRKKCQDGHLFFLVFEDE
jgi:hypothetical protein